MEIKDLFVSHKTVESGAWVGDIPDLGEVRLKVRGLRSPQYREALERETRKVPRKMQDSNGAPLLSERLRIASKLMHEVVLLDWDGLTNEGKPVPYDKALAKEWCTNPDYGHFAEAVAYAASKVDQGRADTEEEVAGN